MNIRSDVKFRYQSWSVVVESQPVQESALGFGEAWELKRAKDEDAWIWMLVEVTPIDPV